MLRFLFGGGDYQGTAANLALLIGRIGGGLLLAFLHGYGKLPPGANFVDGVAALGFPLPFVFAWAAALSEFGASLLIVAGLLTRPAAIAVAVTMSVAAFMAHKTDPLDIRESALIYLTFSLVFLLAGAGRYSLDWLIWRRLQDKSAAEALRGKTSPLTSDN